jgi:hypothetical protein
MTIETEVVRSTAYFHEREPSSRFAATLREVFLVNDSLFVTPSANVREVFLADDNVVQSAFSLLHEVARVHGIAIPSTRYTALAREVARFSDDLFGQRHATATLREVAHLLGRAVAPPTASLHEVARIFGRAAGGGTFAVTLREVFQADSHAYPTTSFRVREVLLIDDAVVPHNRSRATVHEVAHFTDAAWGVLLAREHLHEVFRANDHISARSTWRPLLREVFYADDRALPPPTGRAYTANILTFGMSTYLNYPFLTKAGNYAAGANLWRLDATTDYNTEIAAWVTTGKLDLGMARSKRPSAIYAAGSSLEPLTVTVTGDVNGQLAEFTYTLDLRDQTDYRNNRAFLGKGFRSRYLQFKLGTVKYLGFRLLNAEVDVAVSPRRVA